jgi:hypothetical protein
MAAADSVALHERRQVPARKSSTPELVRIAVRQQTACVRMPDACILFPRLVRLSELLP